VNPVTIKPPRLPVSSTTPKYESEISFTDW
jgi:hypothetical protein